MREIAYSKASTRTLMKMPRNTASLIRSKIEQYAAEPGAFANNVKVLKGEPGICRLRIGDWRVVFDDDGVVIEIIKIAPRGRAYD